MPKKHITVNPAQANSILRGRHEKMIERADKLEHIGWYGSPIKRPPSDVFRKNFDRIKWKKEEHGHDMLGLH